MQSGTKDRARYVGLVAAFVGLIAVSLGCATTVAMSSSGNRSAYYSTPVQSDTIFALGKPDAAAAQQMGAPHAMAFLGKKNTYLLFSGGEELMQVANGLDGNLVSLGSQSGQLFLRDKKVWGTLTLTYGKGGSYVPTPAEIATLTRLGFTQLGKSGVYRKSIAVNGVVYPALTLPEDQAQRFKVNRQLDFYNPPDSSPPPDFSKLIKVPVAIAVDVVTLPLQLAIAGLTVIVISTSHH